MQELPIFKYATLEIPLLATSTGPQFNFPINNYLTNRKVFGLEVFIDNDIDRSPISTGNVTWSTQQMQSASLTLHCFDPTRPEDNSGKADWIKYMPVAALHRLFNTLGTDSGVSVFNKLLLAGLVVDWNNSFITFTQSQTFAVNTSAVFGIYYK